MLLRARPRACPLSEPPHDWKRRLAAPIPILPASRQTHRGQNEARHGIGLREVAPQLASMNLNVLRQQPISIAVLQCVDEEIARLLLAASRPPGVDQPE